MRRKKTDERSKLAADEAERFVDLCLYVLLHERVECYRGISNLTGLSVSTIYRLDRLGANEHTHVGTVHRLGRAAGLKFHEGVMRDAT